MQLEYWIFSCKSQANLEHNYYFCAKFLEEVLCLWVVLLNNSAKQENYTCLAFSYIVHNTPTAS